VYCSIPFFSRPYLRIINLNKGAARYRYLKLVESTRVKGKPVQKTILNFGNIEDWPPERVADLIARLTRFFELSSGPGPEDLSVQEAREFGAGYALGRPLEPTQSLGNAPHAWEAS